MELAMHGLAGRKAFGKVRLGAPEWYQTPWGLLHEAEPAHLTAQTSLVSPKFADTTRVLSCILPFLSSICKKGSVFMELRSPRDVVLGWIVFSPSSYVEVLTLVTKNGTVFGDRVFKNVQLK